MQKNFAYQAKVLITQRRYEEAVQLCREGLQADPTSLDGRVTLAMALLSMQRHHEACDELRLVVEEAPSNVLAQRLLAEAYLRQGDSGLAQEHLAKAGGSSQELPDLRDFLAALPPTERPRAAVPDLAAGLFAPNDPNFDDTTIAGLDPGTFDPSTDAAPPLPSVDGPPTGVASQTRNALPNLPGADLEPGDETAVARPDQVLLARATGGSAVEHLPGSGFTGGGPSSEEDETQIGDRPPLDLMINAMAEHEGISAGPESRELVEHTPGGPRSSGAISRTPWNDEEPTTTATVPGVPDAINDPVGQARRSLGAHRTGPPPTPTPSPPPDPSFQTRSFSFSADGAEALDFTSPTVAEGRGRAEGAARQEPEQEIARHKLGQEGLDDFRPGVAPLDDFANPTRSAGSLVSSLTDEIDEVSPEKWLAYLSTPTGDGGRRGGPSGLPSDDSVDLADPTQAANHRGDNRGAGEGAPGPTPFPTSPESPHPAGPLRQSDQLLTDGPSLAFLEESRPSHRPSMSGENEGAGGGPLPGGARPLNQSGGLLDAPFDPDDFAGTSLESDDDQTNALEHSHGFRGDTEPLDPTNRSADEPGTVPIAPPGPPADLDTAQSVPLGPLPPVSPLDQPVSPDDFTPGPTARALPPDPLQQPFWPEDFGGPNQAGPAQKSFQFNPSDQPEQFSMPSLASSPTGLLAGVPALEEPSPKSPPSSPPPQPLPPQMSPVQAPPAPPPLPDKPPAERISAPLVADPTLGPASSSAKGERALPTELLNKFEGLYKSETKGMTAQTPRRRFSRWLLVLPLLLVAVALAAAIFVTEWYRGQQIEQRRLEARAATATGNYSDYRAALDVYDELLATDPEGGDILAEAARLHAMTALLFGTEDDGRAEKLIGRGKELSIRTGALSPARAAVHLHRGEYDLADKVLNATQRSTGDIAPELIYLRGRWYLSQDNPPEALRRFVAAAEANPDDARLVLAQAEALVAQGSHQDALEKLDHIQQRVEKSVAARLLRAKINIQTGRYPEGGERTAREVLDELAPRAAPGQLAWANLLRARYMVLTEKTVQATKLAAEAQQQQPARDAEFAALLARTLLDVGDATSAIGEADAAVDLAPHLSRYRLLLGEAHLEAGQIDQAEELLKALPPSPKAALLSGRIAHLRGDLDRAQDYFDEAARGEREAPTAKLYIAKILLAKGESREAIRLLTHLSIRPPALPEAHTLLGEAHLSTGDVEAAHQALQIAAEQLPHNPMVRVWIGRVHLSKGEMSLARSAANEALDLEPGYPDGLALVGRILFEEGKLTQAQTAFTTARRSQEDHPEALIGLARVSAERRDFAQAESFLAQLGAQAPQGLLELARGEISLRQYDGSGAISHLRRATKHLPADPLPRSLLGDAYVMRGDRASRTRARREYRASLKMNRDYSRALVGLAELSLLGWSVKAAENALDDIKGLLKQPRVSPALKARIHTALGRFQFELKGNPAAAQEPLKKALKLDPNLAEAHLASGFANQDLGQQRDACTHFRRYLKLAPDGPRADLAEARRGVKFNCQ